MNNADLMNALNTVEQDHHLVLDRMQALKETVGYWFAPEKVDPNQLLKRLREINTFFANEFAAHMEEEEQTLFPFLEQHTAQGKALVSRLRLEHEEIRRKREEFGNCLGFAVELEKGINKMVLRDLLTYGYELWQRLDKHAHVETEAVQECIGRFVKA
jgi:iron-sulfur cluster repair protein YtfE (RIC family)